MRPILVLLLMFVLLISMSTSTSTVRADEQHCKNAVAPVKDGGAAWATTVDCGAISYQNTSMLLGNNAEETSLTTDIQYGQLPSKNSGVRVDLKNANGVALGHLSFGGLHIDCTNESVTRPVVPNGPGGSQFNFANVPKVATAEISLWVGNGNFTKC